MMRVAFCGMFMAVFIGVLGCSAPTEPAAEPGQAGTTASGVQSESPEQVAERLMQAAATQDEAAFLAVLTKKAREALGADQSGSFSGQEYDSYTIGDAVIDGGEASVPVEAVNAGEPESLNLKMRNEDGAWRLYAMAMVLAPDTEMTVNFENMGEMLQELAEGMGDAIGEVFTSAMDNAFGSGSPEEIALKLAMFDALEPVSDEELLASWSLTENLRGTPRAEALNTIAESIDLTIDTGEHTDALSEAVGFDTSGMARLEAIERIANEAGLYSVLPNLQDWGIATAFMESMAEAVGAMIGGEDAAISVDSADAAVNDALDVKATPRNAITFDTNAPTTPPLFLGPFRLDLLEIEENVPHTTGNLMLQLTAHGLPAAVLSVMETHDDSFQVQEVVSADGNPLIDMGMSYMGGGSVVGSAYYDVASRELTGLLRSVDRIARVTGMVEFPRPTSVEELDFETLEEGASQTVGEITVAVDRVDAYTSFIITGPEDVVEGLEVFAQPYDAAGEPVMAHFSDYQSWQAGEGTFSLNADEAPSRIRMKIVLASEVNLYPFAFNAVPLMHAAEQPEQLEALDFGAHDAPLKVTFLAITDRDPNFSEVKVSIENVSNKTPKNTFVDFVYLDGGGNELESFPHTINGEFTTDGYQPIAKPGETVESEQSAFQMPEATKTIAFRVNHVEFMDGTRWEMEQ